MMGAYAFANKLIMAGCSTLLCVWVCLCVFLLHTDAKQNHPGFGNPSAQLSNTFEPSSLEMPTCLGPPKVSVVQRTSVSGRHRKQRDGRFSRSIWNQKNKLSVFLMNILCVPIRNSVSALQEEQMCHESPHKVITFWILGSDSI